MSYIYYILGLVFFSIVLIKATDILIVHLKALTKKTKIGGFFLTSLILGLATSLPELFVGIASALEGSPNLTLGNVIGSNIADLSLVVGLAAVIAGALKIKNGTTSSDVVHAFFAGAAPLMLLWDRTLSRMDGLILISLYGFYNYLILSKKKRQANEDENLISGLFRKLYHNNTRKDFMFVFLGLAFLLFSSDMIVRLANNIAKGMNVPILIIGLFLVAIGTSLPELAFELKAISMGEPEMFMGNLMGSIVANGTLVIGITSFIHPIRIYALNEYLLATIFFIFTFITFFIFIKTKQTLERWEGAILVFIYLVFFLLALL